MEYYTVYLHTNKINGKKYIGMTCQPPEKRWKNGNGYKNNNSFLSDIEKYGWKSFEHKIIASNLSEIEASVIERIIIELFNLVDKENVYNKMIGGLKSGMKGKHHKESTKEMISSARKKGGFSEEHKKHISEAKKGINHHFAKPVYQYKKDGTFLKKWDYMTKASETLNICKTSISSCCLGHRKSAGGYVWSYEKKE